MSSGRPSCGETITTGARASKPRALVVRRHHLLVRISHWLTIPLLLGLILSGISIYWASPIYQHDPNPMTGSFDYFADAGIWICAHTTLAAPLRGPGELGLQLRQSGPLYACLRFAFSLALRVLIDAERTGVSCRALHRRRMAFTAAPVERRSWRSADGEILPEAYRTPYWLGASRSIPTSGQNTTPSSGSPILPL